jgi:hypothetical protein
MVACASACRTRTVYPGTPHQFTAGEIAGAWIGFSDGRRSHDTDLYRLNLRPDGTGVLVEVSASVPSTNHSKFSFDITKWQIATGNLLTCNFRQKDVHGPAVMTSQVSAASRLDTLIRNGPGGWKEGLIFWRETDLKAKLETLTK